MSLRSWRLSLVAKLFPVLNCVLSTCPETPFGWVSNEGEKSLISEEKTVDAEFIASLQSSHEQKLVSFSRELVLSQRDTLGILTQCPQLLRQSMERETLPFIEYLCDSLGIGRPALGRIVISYPAVLASSVKKNAAYVIRFLLEYGVDRDQLKKILRIRPQLLSLRVETNLRPTVEINRPSNRILANLFHTSPFAKRDPSEADMHDCRRSFCWKKSASSGACLRGFSVLVRSLFR